MIWKRCLEVRDAIERFADVHRMEAETGGDEGAGMGAFVKGGHCERVSGVCRRIGSIL